ncbi:transmembrane protein 234 [Amblyraja radiata]|uniref:transmembrane protein 234 n=1 Tax=Amblyraja radiata TaxID=386614 RepID=UPI001402F027|nr:transmembrane protein 234 [Amblyraja radiata]XP_055512644.1 transmembrane protein 234 [Leucoraja erinacea]
MATVLEAFCLVLVSLLWGATNPFLKKGTEGIEKVQSGNWVTQLLAEMRFLVLNYKYLIPFLLNQSGSLLFYFTLASTDLSLAILLTNSLTFVFTALTGKLLGEDIGGKQAMAGMLLTLIGITLCVASNISMET